MTPSPTDSSSNQFCLSNSVFTSDNDESDSEQEQGYDDQLDNNDDQQRFMNHKHHQSSTNDQLIGTLGNNDSSKNDRSNETTPTPRLPTPRLLPLSMCQVHTRSWTNDGSRTPQYNRPVIDTDQQDISGNGLDNNIETDSLRRLFRARSLSLNMESRRGNRGTITFRSYPSASQWFNSNANRAMQNLYRSVANINLIKEKIDDSSKWHYHDARRH
ncbi:MAG: hypothetical protein J3R72DRAFT_497018 [Linnemannia gamsii]|nr:MAG: hypothetical protein J3R72DRAFT_497018 [Linnemannia gamsii]